MVIYVGTFIKVKRYEKSVSVEHYICEKCERKYYQREQAAPEFCQHCGIALKEGSDTIERKINMVYDICEPVGSLVDLGVHADDLYIGSSVTNVHYQDLSDEVECYEISETFADVKDIQKSFEEFCVANASFLMTLEEQCRDYQICTGTLIL